MGLSRVIWRRSIVNPPAVTVGDVARGHRAVQLTGVAGLADGEEGFAIEFGCHCLGFFFEFEVARF